MLFALLRFSMGQSFVAFRGFTGFCCLLACLLASASLSKTEKTKKVPIGKALERLSIMYKREDFRPSQHGY
jgi:hypothetical protein